MMDQQQLEYTNIMDEGDQETVPYIPVFTEETSFNFGQIMLREKDYPNMSWNSLLADHIIELAMQQTSIKLLQNKNMQLEAVEEQLTGMVEGGRIDISTFSQNCLTNVSKYDQHTGDTIEISSISIAPQSKKYTEVEVLDNMPHQVRKRVPRGKKHQEVLVKKTQNQVLQEFELLSKMFTVDITQGGEEGSENQILQTLNFSDSSYNDLWNRIIGQMDLTSTENGWRSKGITLEIKDQQIDDIVGRIMREAAEYQQEVIGDQEEQDQEGNQQSEVDPKEKQTNQRTQQEMIEKKQKKQEVKKDFQAIKINRKAQMNRDPKYPFAIEDQSDLTNFYDVLPKDQFAKQYPFQLDQFQKRSILHLERKESVFVAAHTSAGKTVVAEYGIALAQKHKRKVIYTSPIKALSNQKYRELSKIFDSVGIVTGDVSLNQSATCVIMTTEILRNNLYKGAEMIRDIQWVIFDEIHYINNAERGVVWEQTIIMLPQHIGLIMLSATVPNYMEFANWVGRTKRRTIFVMKTFHRPVPLQHSLFIFNKFHVIKEANGRFLNDEYNFLKGQIFNASVAHLDKKEQLKQAKQEKIQERGFYNDPRREQKLKLLNKGAVDKFIKKIQKSDMDSADGKEEFRILQALIADCDKKNLLPCVVFTFSKKKINSLVKKIYTNVLTDRKQQFKITSAISKALSNLKPQDQDIEQFIFLRQICRAGYAIHHGDLLPLAKEIVQLLFSQGLIKVLFATETFAMGINMPTKTVIFNEIKKVSGSEGQLRFLNSSEYVQMSGRAGRRGLDEKGNVIIMVKDPKNLPETDHMVKMIDHPGQQLQSKFKITYDIILNLFNSQDISVKDMMQRSYFQNPKFSQLSSNIQKVKQLKKSYEELSEIVCPYNKLGTRNLIEQYMNNADRIRDANWQIFNSMDAKKMNLPKYGLLLGHNNETQLCIILRVNYELKKKDISRYVQVLLVNEVDTDVYINKKEMEEADKTKNAKKRVVLEYEKRGSASEKVETAPIPNTKNQFHYYASWIQPSQILQIYTNKLPNTKQMDFSRQAFEYMSTELITPPSANKLIPLGLPQIPQSAIRIGLLQQYKSLPCHNCQIKQKHRRQHQEKVSVKKKMLRAAADIDTSQLGMMGSFDGMIKMLKHFKFIQDDTLTLKGRVARELDIYVTEVIMEGVLQPLDSEEVAALLSAFVCDYKPRPTRSERQKQDYFPSPFSKQDKYTYNLQQAIDQTYAIIKRMTNQQLTSQCYFNASSQDQMIMCLLNFHLVDTVYKWAGGFDFRDAMSDTRAPEGVIVKTIMRLNMLLTNIKSVCRILGSSDLQQKVDTAGESIRRDIVFCQSLYLTG